MGYVALWTKASVIVAGIMVAGFTPVMPLPAIEHRPQQAQAEQPKPDEIPDIEPVQVPLTADLVSRFLKSYPDLLTLSRDLNRRRPPPPSSDVEESVAFTLLPHLANPASSAEINRILQKYGFASYSDWANAAHSISLAAEAAEPNAGTDDLDSEKKQAIADIDADDTLSADEKAAAKVELDNQFAALAEFVPLPGNVDTVKPFMELIRTLGLNSGSGG